MIWKDINGYDGKYKMNSNGNVMVNKTKKLLKPLKNKHRPYLYYGLYKDGAQNKITLHRLLGLTFIPNPFNKELVLHKNDDIYDNGLDNLYWGNHSDNMKDKFNNGYSIKGENSPTHKLTSIDVSLIRVLLNTKLFTQKEIGNMFNVSYHCIGNIKNNKTWRYDFT